MAENDFLSGLLGGVKDVGGSIYGGISGLLGGGEQTPAAGGQMQDSMSMLSPADQKRLMFSTLGQVGAALLAAGARQSPESRAQALAQLGKIGPGIEESIQRNAAFQQQRIAAQRQNELFPIQLAAARAGLAQQNIGQAKSILELQGQATNLQKQIDTYDRIGLPDQANAARGQLANIQQVIRSLPSGGGAPAGASAPAMGQTLPTKAAPAAITPAQPAVTTVPAPAQITGTELPPPVEGAPAPMIPAPAVPVAPAAQAPALSKFDQYVQTNLPYLTRERVRSVFNAKPNDPEGAMADLLKLNEDAQQQQLTNETKVRNDFIPKSDRYDTIQKAYLTLPNLGDLKSGISDHALILSYYKIFDPGSVVSTNETGQLQASSGALDSALQGRLNRVLTGELLTPKERMDLYASAKAKFEQEYSSYEKAYGSAVKNAEAFKLDPERSVPDVRDPQVISTVRRERDLADISRNISANDVLTLGLEDLNLLDPSKMTKPARDAAKAQLDRLQKAAMVPPPVATTEQPQQGYGLGQNPLRGAMQNYPRGLLRENQLPPVGY